MPKYAAEVLIDLNVELSDNDLSDTSDDVGVSLYEMGNIQSCLDMKFGRDVVVSRGIQCGRSRIHRHKRPAIPIFSSSELPSNDSSSSSSSHNTSLWRQSRQRNRNCNAYSLSNEHHPRRHHISYHREENVMNHDVSRERVRPRPRYSLTHYPQRHPIGPSHSQLREVLRQPHSRDIDLHLSKRQINPHPRRDPHVTDFRDINERVPAPRVTTRYVGPGGDTWPNPPHSHVGIPREKPGSWSEEPETELLPDLSLKEEVDPVTSDSTLIQTNLDERRKLFQKFTGAQVGNADVAPTISFIGERRPKPIPEERECSTSMRQSHEELSFHPFSSKTAVNESCETFEPEPLEETSRSRYVLFTRGSEETSRKGVRNGGSHSHNAPDDDKKGYRRRVLQHPVRPLPKPPRPSTSRMEPRRPPWNCNRTSTYQRDSSVHPTQETPIQSGEVPSRNRVRLLTRAPRRPRKMREEDAESKDHESLAPTESDCLVQHRFFLPESAAVEQIVSDPSDRRIKAICDRLRCDIDIYPRMPRAGFFKNMLVIGAPNTTSLRKCVRSLDQSMNWCLSSQLKQL